MEIQLKKGNVTAKARTLGGELTSLVKDGTEYIWCGDSQIWNGINPLLFPNIGFLKDGQICYEGVPYPTPKHGIARTREFQVVEQTEDSVVLELVADEESMKLYPYKFSLKSCHKITEAGFITTLIVENTDTKDMPFTIGGHTAYNCPIDGEGAFEDYKIIFDEGEELPTLVLNEHGNIMAGKSEKIMSAPGVIDLKYEDFVRLDTEIFDQLKSHGVTLKDKKTGRGLHVDFAGFPMLGIWTMAKKNAPYICIEPWNGCAAFTDESGEFTDKKYCITLKPGEKKEFSYEMKILEK